MGRTKKRSKAKSASARTRLAAKLPHKVIQRIIDALCPSTFGFGLFSHEKYVVGTQRALNFALVCTTWRDVGLARYWRHVLFRWGQPAPAPQLAARTRQGLVSELTVIGPKVGEKQLLRAWGAALRSPVGQRLRALILWNPPALELFPRSIPTSGFSSLVELHIYIYESDYAHLKRAYETFAHMPKLECFSCFFEYRAARTPSPRPRMPAPRRRLARLELRLEPETLESIVHARVELDAVADLLYVADLSSLRELKLYYNVSHAVPCHLAPLLPNLRILRLVAPAVLFPSFPTALTSMLVDLPGLVAIDVEIYLPFGRDIGLISPSDASSLLAALPLSLEVALIEFDFSLPASSAHLTAFLERRLALGVLKRRYGGGGGEGDEARWETVDFEELESAASPRIV
ncbi:hypothetical protein JCM9279_004977 [Rhodotorula babjevae]